MYEDFTDNGTTSSYHSRGDFTFHVSGGFDSGTVTLQRQGLDGTWRDVPDAAYTTNTEEKFSYPNQSRYFFRAVVTGVAAASATLHVEFLD